MNLSSGRIVVTKFPSTGYKMLFLSFVTLTKGKKEKGKNKEENESKEETGSEEKGQRGGGGGRMLLRRLSIQKLA